MNKKYIIDEIENREFMRSQIQNLLRFGMNFPSEGGGSYYLGGDGTPMKDRPRETWITCRMAHVYSIGKIIGMEGCAELAKKAIDGLLSGELRDKKNGGWYAGINADGSIIPNKQCYAHAFVILAGTSACVAGIEGGKELLDEALCVFDKFFWDEEKGLTYDTWNTEFTELDEYRGLNANMHTVEAFLAVADVLGDRKYLDRAGRIISHVIGWAKNNDYRIPEHFHADWTVDLNKNIDKPDDPFKPFGATPGHGIEWARLITLWALNSAETYAKDAKPYIEDAEKIYDRAIEDGWDADGERGICYTTDWNGNPVVRDRMHWTLAEAIFTTSVFVRLKGQDKHKQLFSEFMQYLDECVIDHENGSWFHQLDENNHLKETVWPGKSDLYHALQAVISPYNKISLSIAKGVKESKR